MKLTFYGRIDDLEEAVLNALDATAEKLLGDVVDAQVIPFDKGTLQNAETYVDYSERSKGIERIVSNTPYARRLYFHPEYNFRTEATKDKKGKTHGGNKNARAKWLDEWANGKYKDQIARDYAAFFKQFSGMK